MHVALGEQVLLDLRTDSVGEKDAVGYDDAAASTVFQLAHDELEEEPGGLGGAGVRREIGEHRLLLLTAKGRIGEYNVHLFTAGNLGDRPGEGVATDHVGLADPVEHQVHHAEQVGHRLLLDPVQVVAQIPELLGRLEGGMQLVQGFDQEATGAAGGVEDHLTELGGDLLDHESDHRTRCVELTGVSGGVTHLPQHGLVEERHGVHVVGGGEVDLVDLVDHVAQEIARQHPVMGLLEDGGEHVPGIVASSTGEVPEIREKFVVDELHQVLACLPVGIRSPVTPAVGLLDRRTEALPLGDRAVLLVPVECSEEEEPGELRYAVEVAVEAGVLSHDVPGRLDGTGELGSRGGGHVLLLARWHCQVSLVEARVMFQKFRRVSMALATVGADRFSSDANSA